MAEAATFFAYDPTGRGVMCALFYVVHDDDVYGWWIGAEEGKFPPAFFMLEKFYSIGETRLYATEGNDVYGGCRVDYTVGCRQLADPLSLPQDMCHELERQQSAFVQEWLFFADGSEAAAEVGLLEKAGLPVKPVNVREKRLHKFDRHSPVWTYASPATDLNIIDFLRQRWPLDYRLNGANKRSSLQNRFSSMYKLHHVKTL